MNDALYLEDVQREFRRLKKQADASLAQVNDEQFFARIDPNSNSLAIVCKHLSGNLLSRWKDFLTTDGEKPTRNRDGEFEVSGEDSRQTVAAKWEEGWATLFDTLAAIEPAHLDSVVTIRGEPHTVLEAINRQLTHYGAHVGQIILLAKHFAGPHWKTLSIPKGKSREFNREPARYK